MFDLNNSATHRLLSGALMIATSGFAAAQSGSPIKDTAGNSYASTNKIVASDQPGYVSPYYGQSGLAEIKLHNLALKSMRGDAKKINALLQSSLISVEQAHKIDYANAGFAVQTDRPTILSSCITPTGFPPGKYKLGDLPIHQTQFCTSTLLSKALEEDTKSSDGKKIEHDASELHKLLLADKKILQQPPSTSSAQNKQVGRIAVGDHLIDSFPDDIQKVLSGLHLTDNKSIQSLNVATENFRHATGQSDCSILAVGMRLHPIKIVNGQTVMGSSGVSEDFERREADGIKAKMCAESAVANKNGSSDLKALLAYSIVVDSIASKENFHYSK